MLTLVISNKNVANYCGLLFACLHLPYFLQHASITFAMTKSSTVLHVKHFLECLSPAQTSLLTSRLRNPLLAVPSTRARTQGYFNFQDWGSQTLQGLSSSKSSSSKDTDQREDRIWYIWKMRTYCCCSITQSCPTLCYPMNCSRQGFPVLHHLPEFAQTHMH